MASTNRDEISRLELLHAAHPDGLVFPHLADAYRRAGRYAQAESVLNAGLRNHSEYSSAHVVLGRLRLDQGKRREAENAFQRVLQLDPQNHIALEFLGRLATEEGRVEDALGYLRRLATLKPSDEVAEQIADLERQAAETRAATGADTDSAPTGNGSGGRPPDAPAEREGDPAVELPEPGEVVTETMAELYARQGLHERAEAVYRELYERDPSNARIKRRLDEAVARLQGDEASPEPPTPPEAQEAPTTPGPRSGPSAPSAPSAPSVPSVPSAPSAPSAPSVPSAPSTPTTSTRSTPQDGEAPGDAEHPGTSIREYLGGVLSWTPGAETGGGGGAGAAAGSPSESSPATPGETEAEEGPAPDLEREPWAAAPVSPPGEVAGPETDAVEAETPEADSREVETPEAPPPEAESPKTEAPEAEMPEAEAPEAEVPPSLARSGAARDTAAPTPEELGLVEDDLEDATAGSQALVALTDMLVGLLEYRDPFFRGSSSLTRLLATNVARELGLGPEERVNLALAAVLRDLGRLALGGRLVKSPQLGRTPEARRKIERHVDLALELLEGIDLPRSVTLAVQHHHERWDGGGYPAGLSGADIPLPARVLAVADSFAAMVSPRSYRLPRKVPDAAREMEEQAGEQYDPTVVDALLRVLERRDHPRFGFVQRHHILMVNRDQPGAVVTAAKLCTAGYLAEVAVDVDAARERLRRVPVSALVISAEAAEPVAELIRDLRLDPLFASLPIVVVEAETVALRVRLLESGADVCFPPGISHGELQGTLGALVRRTLRSRETAPEAADEEAPWLALQGDIQDFPLAWLLQVMKYDSRTAGIGIRTATDQGAIYIESGDAVHARIRGGKRGEAALKEMLQWRKGRFTVQPDARSKERSIESSIMHLLLTQAVEEDHAAAGVFGAVSDQG